MSCDAVLKKNGLKLTPQRRLILDIIHRKKAHVTGEEIVREVQSRMPGINKSTVYRTLDLLEGLGTVVKSQQNDRAVYHHAEEGHHHHLVCRKCGKTVSCDEDIFRPVERAAAKYGFNVNFNHSIIDGVCEKCSSGENK